MEAVGATELDAGEATAPTVFMGQDLGAGAATCASGVSWASTLDPPWKTSLLECLSGAL